MRTIIITGIALGAFMLGTSGPALASDVSAYEKVAIQKRRYQLANELRLAVGALPIDPYRKGFSGTISYTRHLTDSLAWEIISASATVLTRTDLTDELVQVFGARADSSRFAAPRFVLTTGIELTPLYGKWAFLNDSQVNHAFIVGGYGGVIFGNRPATDNPTLDEFDVGQTLSDIRPSLGPGLGYRLYFSQSWSARVDTRLLFSARPEFQEGDSFQVDAVLLINLGLSFNFGADI
jgi:outer membrane beta-barrel protein